MLRRGSQHNCGIKSENSHIFLAIHQNAYKLDHTIKRNDVNSFLALSVDKVGHVTCYECFLNNVEIENGVARCHITDIN